MKTLNFDMDALRAMVVGVDLGGFSHAALRLNRSPSAISMQLRKLERQAGQCLFKRSGRGLKLTEAGDVLLQHARRVLALNDEMGMALGAIAMGGTVRAGIPQDFADTLLQELLTRFTKVRPNTHVEIRAGRNYVLADDVASGRLDLAVAFAPGGSGGKNTIATLPAIWIGRMRLGGLPLKGRPVPLVIFDGPCLFRDLAMDSLGRSGMPMRLAMTTPSLAGVWCGVRAGLGVTVRTPLAIPRALSPIPRRAGLPALHPVDVVLHAAAEQSDAVQEFRLLLLEIVSRECRNG